MSQLLFSLRALGSNAAKVERVTLLGVQALSVKFGQSAEALPVTPPPSANPSIFPNTLRIEGSHPLGAVKLADRYFSSITRIRPSE
jgi:hypothetical protein